MQCIYIHIYWLNLRGNKKFIAVHKQKDNENGPFWKIFKACDSRENSVSDAIFPEVNLVPGQEIWPSVCCSAFLWEFCCPFTEILEKSCLSRIAKCHWFDRIYLCKILACRGKSLEKHTILQNQVFWGKISKISTN